MQQHIREAGELFGSPFSRPFDSLGNSPVNGGAASPYRFPTWDDVGLETR